MLKRNNLKFEKSNVLQVLVIITSGIIVLLGLIDLITYYAEDSFIKLSWPVGTFLSIGILAFVSALLALKGKSFLGALILLALSVLDNGISFFRELLSGNLDFKSFADFQSLTYFVLATLLIVFLFLDFKKGSKPTLRQINKPNQLILVLISLGYFLFFNQLMFTVFFASILLLLILFAEEVFIPKVIIYYSLTYIFLFIDYFITLNKFPNYEMPVYQWLEILLGIGLLVIAFVSIIKPNFLANKPKQIPLKEE